MTSTAISQINSSQPIVVKLGGSLFRLNKACCVQQQVQRWLGQLSEANRPILLVVGGGHNADQVRAHQKDQCWDDRRAHWAAIAAMRENAVELAARLALPTFRFTNSADCHSWICHSGSCRIGVAILEDSFLDVPELPWSWDVTSDSIALWFASRIRANYLILAKRVRPLEPLMACGKMRGLGWVDPHFGELLNLRSVGAMLRSRTGQNWPSDSQSIASKTPLASPAEIWVRHFHLDDDSVHDLTLGPALPPESAGPRDDNPEDQSQLHSLSSDIPVGTGCWTKMNCGDGEPL